MSGGENVHRLSLTVLNPPSNVSALIFHKSVRDRTQKTDGRHCQWSMKSLREHATPLSPSPIEITIFTIGM